MGKREILCPHCNTQKFKIETDKSGRLKNLKGGKWKPLLKKVDSNHWVKNHDLGIVVLCKCGKHTFLYNFSATLDDLESSMTVPDGSSIPVYCSQCRIAFMHSELICPTCEIQY
ncbi:MAG: hypothetical protein ACW98Y_10650 [Candidatus Thorarchaeota archaeon]